MRHSYTKISMWMQCPMKMKGRYVLKIKEERSTAAQRGVDIHTCFENAVSDGVALPAEFSFYEEYVRKLRALGAKPELKMAVRRDWQPTDYDSEDAWLIGIADLWLVQGKIAYGWDWKTGKIYDDHVKQKEFYTCLLADAHPEVDRFVFSNIYLDLKDERTHKFTRFPQQEKDEKGNWLPDVDLLRTRWGNRIAVMERDTECVPTPSFSCRYCAVSKARGGPCPF